MRVPWRDRQGRFLKFNAAVLACTPIPALIYAFWWIDGDLGARSVNAAIHGMGSWAVRWLVLSLAITPFARIIEWPNLLTVRRMVGLTALAYALAHFSLYIVDQKFNLLIVASEIALRFYLTIGFVALCGLIALGVTSTDAALKRMGKRWKQLHRLAYPIGVLALLHFFIQTKANVAEPVFVTGLFLWMMVWRVLPAARRTALTTLLLLVPVSAVLTAAVEFAWYGLATKIDPFRILTANWSERFFPRPAHEVAGVALLVAIVVAARRLLMSRSSARPTPRVSPVEANPVPRRGPT
jgi:methionine sulfoxide reductase heme-binding subunit